MKSTDNIFITGSSGMVGTSLVSLLKRKGFTSLHLPTSKELNLTNQNKVESFFKQQKIDHVIHLAGRVGGIGSNIAMPVEYLYDNSIMALNIIHAAQKSKIKKFLFLGSSCVYPRECKQPMKEEDLLTGKLEPTNEGYALAKIIGLKMCEYSNSKYHANFINLLPCNIYGPHDRFDAMHSHVIASLLLKFHLAKRNNDPTVELWGTGNARREFIYSYDVCESILYFMQKWEKSSPPFLNIGTGVDYTIKELASMIKNLTGYEGKMVFNHEKPDGMPQKLMDISKAKSLGWTASTTLQDGLKKTYEWYTKHETN